LLPSQALEAALLPSIRWSGGPKRLNQFAPITRPQADIAPSLGVGGGGLRRPRQFKRL